MLWVTAVPVGHAFDLSLRALELLKTCDVIICESTKETSKLLRAHGVIGKTYEVLDEHSKSEDLQRLVQICADQQVALVSDGGTPAFCDPGADLVALCRQQKISVKPLLGASSLMGLLCLAGQRLDQFVFRGFIPAESVARKKSLVDLQREKRAIVLMDTPYRLRKMLGEIAEHFPNRKIFLVCDLSLETEACYEGFGREIGTKVTHEKAEFMLLISPEKSQG